MADALNARTFAMAQQLGLPLMNICSTCQGIESMVQDKLAKDPEYLDKVNAILADEGLTYTPGLEIKNFLWVLVEDFGLDKLKSMVKRPLTGIAHRPVLRLLHPAPERDPRQGGAPGPRQLPREGDRGGRRAPSSTTRARRSAAASRS